MPSAFVGRKTGETWYAADGVMVVDTLSYSYDGEGNLLSASNSHGGYAFTYDYDGRLLTVSEPLLFSCARFIERARLKNSLM